VKGGGGEYDFGARMYDSRLGKFLSLDPLMDKYVSYSPYSFCLDNPIRFVDVEGKTIGDANSPATLMAKSQLQKTEAGKILWNQLETSERVIYFHQAKADGTKDEKTLYKKLGSFGSTVGQAQFEKIKNGQDPGLEEMKKDYKFNTSTGEWETTSKEIHIIINVTAIEAKYTIEGLIKGEKPETTKKNIDDATQFTVAEESIHSIEKTSDMGYNVTDKNDPKKFVEPTSIKDATSIPYSKRKFENAAHKKAEKITGVKNPQAK
jgi:hypothetical protein